VALASLLQWWCLTHRFCLRMVSRYRDLPLPPPSDIRPHDRRGTDSGHTRERCDRDSDGRCIARARRVGGPPDSAPSKVVQYWYAPAFGSPLYKML